MRDTAFWTDATVRLLKEHFVAVAVNGMSMNNRKDADKEFIYDICQLRLAGAGGNLIVVTASGKQLGGTNGVSSNLPKAWEEWNALPEAERKPGAVKVPEPGLADPEHGPAQLPPGALILKQHYRLLANGDIAERLDRLARTLPAPAARKALATIDRALTALERNAGTKLVTEWVASEI